MFLPCQQSGNQKKVSPTLPVIEEGTYFELSIFVKGGGGNLWLSL